MDISGKPAAALEGYICTWASLPFPEDIGLGKPHFWPWHRDSYDSLARRPDFMTDSKFHRCMVTSPSLKLCLWSRPVFCYN